MGRLGMGSQGSQDPHDISQENVFSVGAFLRKRYVWLKCGLPGLPGLEERLEEMLGADADADA
jgi:hypothetical protein